MSPYSSDCQTQSPTSGTFSPGSSQWATSRLSAMLPSTLLLFCFPSRRCSYYPGLVASKLGRQKTSVTARTCAEPWQPSPQLIKEKRFCAPLRLPNQISCFKSAAAETLWHWAAVDKQQQFRYFSPVSFPREIWYVEGFISYFVQELSWGHPWPWKGLKVCACCQWMHFLTCITTN